MENDTYYFRVGLFVAVVIIAAIFALSWLGANRDQKDYIKYAIYFEGSVNGLNIGSPVKLKGIEIGTVQSISFHSYEDDLILVLVDILDTAPIRNDTVASLQPQGITGVSFISLENTGDDPSYIMRKEGEPYLTIQSRHSELEQIFKGAPEMIHQFTAFGKRANTLLSDENIHSVEQALHELKQLLSEGKITMREIKMLARTLREDPSQVIRGPKYEGYKAP